MNAGELIAELPGGGRVLFTERSHGNMSSVGGERRAGAEDARERLRRLIGVERLVRGHQVHGAHVELIDATHPPRPPAGEHADADGEATALAGIGAMALAADCMPVALGCEGAVAIVHAGWRGIAAGVLEAGVDAIRRLGGHGPIHAVAGPAAGACCYEVGPEVHEVFGHAHRHGRRIDLRAIAHDRLLAAGAARVLDVEACTICDERFFSHRREGPRAGRQVGVAWLS